MFGAYYAYILVEESHRPPSNVAILAQICLPPIFPIAPFQHISKTGSQGVVGEDFLHSSPSGPLTRLTYLCYPHLISVPPTTSLSLLGSQTILLSPPTPLTCVTCLCCPHLINVPHPHPPILIVTTWPFPPSCLGCPPPHANVHPPPYVSAQAPILTLRGIPNEP
jgi:hypothetical protein